VVPISAASATHSLKLLQRWQVGQSSTHFLSAQHIPAGQRLPAEQSAQEPLAQTPSHSRQATPPVPQAFRLVPARQVVPSQQPVEQLAASQTQASPLQRCPAAQLLVSQLQPPSPWQTCPGAPQTRPTKAKFGSQRPVAVLQLWQRGQAGEQTHEPQSRLWLQLLATCPQRSAHVWAADSEMQLVGGGDARVGFLRRFLRLPFPLPSSRTGCPYESCCCLL